MTPRPPRAHWSARLPPTSCDEAVIWARQQPSYVAAWRTCERGDWLLWLLAAVGEPRRHVVRAACACARIALYHVPRSEDRPRRCLDMVDAWTRGEATIEQVREARTHAYAAADGAVYAADDAAYAAAACAASADDDAAADDAVYAADDAAACAASAASAASAVYADDDASASAARAETLRRCADIVRAYCPRPPLPVRRTR